MSPFECELGETGCADYIGLEKYLDAECFSVLPVKVCNFCTNRKGLIRLIAHGAFNQREWSWEPFWKLELIVDEDVPSNRDPGELVYVQRLERLFQELQSGHSLVFGLSYCCYAMTYDRMHLLGNSKVVVLNY